MEDADVDADFVWWLLLLLLVVLVLVLVALVVVLSSMIPLVAARRAHTMDGFFLEVVVASLGLSSLSTATMQA